jgi:hypothetical protein
MIGYRTQIIDSVGVDGTSNLGLIYLEPTAIEMPEVVIKSVKPMIEFHADKQVLNMDRLPGNNGSVTDALKNSGIVEVDPSTKKVTVRGQDLKLQMDGHDYDMPAEVLAQLPASMLDQVEVVLSPGAKESAEGGTYILNLISKKNTISNYSGMVTINPTSKKDIYGGMYVNYKTGGMNLFGEAYSGYYNFDNKNETERYVYTSPAMYYQKSSGNGKNKYKYGYFKAGFDYDFDEKNTSTFYVNYNGYKINSENTGGSIVNNRNDVFQYSYNQLNNNTGTNNSLSFYGFYKKTFGAKGNDLILDAMYTIFTNPSEAKMNNKYSNKPGTPELQNSNTGVNNKNLIVKADYALPINMNKLEAGYSFTYRTRKNDYNVLNYSYRAERWLDSLSLSNLFNYTESIQAVYASYAHKLGNFDIKLGLRTENLSTEGDQVTQNITFSENFLSLFPSLNVSYKLSDMFQLGFNAFRRVTYPQVYYINPFRQYTSKNVFRAGNPKLEPMYVNSYALNLSQYISIFYNYTTGSFTSAMTTENDSTLVSSFLNLNNEKSYGVNLTLPYYNTPMAPFHLPDFISNFFIAFNYRYSKQSGQYLTEDLSLTNKIYSLNGNIGFKLWYDVDANVSVYFTPRIENRRTVSSAQTYTYIDLSKSFLENKLKLNLSVSDVFRSQKYNYESIGGNYYTKSHYEMLNSQSISLGISYIFNDYKTRRDRNLNDGRDSSNDRGGGGMQ